MRIDFPNLEVLHAHARRERAEMVWRLLIVPVIRFFHRERKHAVPLRSRLA